MSKLLELDRIVIQQKAKLIELTNEYKLFDQDGTAIGVVREEGQSGLKKALRFVSKVDQFLTHTLAVYDDADTKVLELTRPAKVFKSKVEIKDGTGRVVGSILQKNVFGKIRFDLVGAGGNPMGQIRAENWRAWNFAIVDQSEKEVARITKTWEGLGKAVFTTADNYVVEVSSPLTADMRLLVLAAGVGVDTALKQDDRGL